MSTLFILVLVFQVFDVAIPDFPLSDLPSDVFVGRGTSGSSFLSDFWVDGLHFSTVVIELVSHRLLDCYMLIDKSYPRHSCLSLVIIVKPGRDTH